MSFDWADYLSLAQELSGNMVSQASQEAKLRSAISRAYYAAFCKARNHLRDKEGYLVTQEVEVHQDIRNEFKRSDDKEHRQIGQHLDRLRRDRNKVDYDDNVASLDKMTKQDLGLAEKIFILLSRIS